MSSSVERIGRNPGYPLVENRVQAEIMAYAHAEGRPFSRARLTGALSSSRGKVTAEISRLMEIGVLAENGLAESEGGRPSSLLQIPRSAGYVASIFIGATSVDVALTTLGSEVVSHRAEAADVREGPRPLLGRVREMLSGMFAERGAEAKDVLSIGVGVPGPVEQASGLLTVPPIMPGWDRFPIREAFAGEYAAPVFVDNEVNAMALGEHWGGVGKKVDDMIFVKIGTGIGAGIIISGRLHRGPQGSAGDFGHVCVDPEGPICSCGNTGCLEAMAAAPAIAREAEKCARVGDSAILAEILAGKGELSSRDVADAALHGDRCALMVIRRSGRLIGQTIATLVSVLNPSLIVIGGGVSHIGTGLLAEIRSSVYSRSLPLATRTLPIVMSELDETAGIVGASVMAAEGVFTVSG